MATYNGARFLGRQLESFSQQTLLPSELIVCDDGSTDATVSIVNEFARSAPFPVRVVENPARIGYTANFLQAARMCRGNLIALSDQDDEWLPAKFERVLQASRESDALLFAHAEEWMDENGKPMGVIFPTDRRYRSYLRANDFNGHTLVIRRPLLDMTSNSLTALQYKALAGDIELDHDALLLEVATAMDKVFFIPDVLGRWRLYSESSHPWTKQWTKQVKPAPRATASFADRIFPSDLARRYAESASVHRKRAEMLLRLMGDLKAVERDAAAASARLLASAEAAEKQAAIMELRASFYSSHPRSPRIRLMFEGAAMGQYRKPAKGGLGMREAIRDALVCFFHTDPH